MEKHTTNVIFFLTRSQCRLWWKLSQAVRGLLGGLRVYQIQKLVGMPSIPVWMAHVASGSIPW